MADSMSTGDDTSQTPETPECALLFKTISAGTWPIVYSPDYNIKFFALEKLSTFDSGKWGRIFTFLKEADMLDEETVVSPRPITQRQLLEFHSLQYLKSLTVSRNVARITEIMPIWLLPASMIEDYLLNKLKLQTSGTILAAKLALGRGWSINIGGGFHHCSRDAGGGFCAYADISGALRTLKSCGLIESALIIDLDAHQGNGHERDFMDDEWVHTLDMFNSYIYPGDYTARAKKNLMEVLLKPGTGDDEYLEQLQLKLSELSKTLGGNKPSLIAYNAGTDLLRGDPLGGLDITKEGVLKRDLIVFRWAKERDIPLFMVTSGGYSSESARVVADSILNLHRKKLIYLSPGAALPTDSPGSARL